MICTNTIFRDCLSNILIGWVIRYGGRISGVMLSHRGENRVFLIVTWGTHCYRCDEPYWLKRYYMHACEIGRVAFHYNDVIMGALASQIIIPTIVYSTVYAGADQRKHQCSASLAFVRVIHLWLVNSPHKLPVTRKMFPFHDAIMLQKCHCMIRVFTDIIHTHFISTCTITGKNPASWNFRLNKIYVSCFMYLSIVFLFRREKSWMIYAKFLLPKVYHEINWFCEKIETYD